MGLGSTLKKAFSAGTSGSSGSFSSAIGGANLNDALGVTQQIEQQQDYQSQYLQAQQQWQEQMSNTAHQREVNDLTQAGLNPVLSNGGSGASSVGVSGSPGSSGSGSGASGTLGSIMSMIMPYVSGQRRSNLSGANLSDANADLADANRTVAQATADNIGAQTQRTKINTAMDTMDYLNKKSYFENLDGSEFMLAMDALSGGAFQGGPLNKEVRSGAFTLAHGLDTQPNHLWVPNNTSFRVRRRPVPKADSNSARQSMNNAQRAWVEQMRREFQEKYHND